MPAPPDFDPLDFLPYLLAQAAETLGRDFEKVYKARYGMLRTEWRVLFHLGCYGPMTAREICERGRLHKTKVSRAVSALERKRFVKREEMAHDRRSAALSLTRAGETAFADMAQSARAFDDRVRASLKTGEIDGFVRCLLKLSGLKADLKGHPSE